MISDLVAHLQGDVALSALIGTRIYPQILPQNGTLPALVYQLISRTPASMRNANDNLVQTRWQWSINARTYAGCVAISTQLKATMQNFSNSDPRVDHLFLDNERDDTEPEFDENNYYRRMLDVLIWHEE